MGRRRSCRLYLESDEEYSHMWCIVCEREDIPYTPDGQCPYCGSDKVVPYHQDDDLRHVQVWG